MTNNLKFPNVWIGVWTEANTCEILDSNGLDLATYEFITPLLVWLNKWSWTSQAQERSLPAKRSKLQEEQEILEAEITATALEGEGKFDETNRDNFFSRATQVDIEVPCTHRFFNKYSKVLV